MLIIVIAIISIGMCIGAACKTKDVFSVNGREVPIYSVQRTDNRLAMTFNCAWNDDDIDSILEILDKYKVKATFFVVGNWAEKYPEALKKLCSAGMEIGNHSYNHAHYSAMTKDEIITNMQKCDDVVFKITGEKIYLFRGAYGEYDDKTIKACDETERTYIQWSKDSLDYKAKSCGEIISRVTQNAAAGDIILMHNGTQYTKDSLDAILKNLTKRFELCKVSELIYSDNYYIDATGRQFLK